MATATKKPKAPTLTQRVEALDREARHQANSDYGYNHRIKSLSDRVSALERTSKFRQYRVTVKRDRLQLVFKWEALVWSDGSGCHTVHGLTPRAARRRAERWIKKDIKRQAKPADPNVGTFYVDAGSN